MSKGPEANFWNTIRNNLPKDAFATRIENRSGGGIPDVHVLWEGMTFWTELKIAKHNRINLSSHQIAWHMAYYARGGLSFFLVKAPAPRGIHLFSGSQGPALLHNGLTEAPVARIESAKALFPALRPLLVGHYRAAALRLGGDQSHDA
jgi:hypothetical protein